jgi:hypothetical protein
MNIFEQYGIKEVADCTLYAIELDKNDDELYIPVLYFDTLKVSSIEQTAEQTSAKGGLGNPELITWDYGKEISVSLEDALYNPASQSLMWGGKFGTKNSKIHGIWNPFVYSTDENGRTEYLKKEDVVYLNSTEAGKLGFQTGGYYAITTKNKVDSYELMMPVKDNGNYSSFKVYVKQKGSTDDSAMTDDNSWGYTLTNVNLIQDPDLDYYVWADDMLISQIEDLKALFNTADDYRADSTEIKYWDNLLELLNKYKGYWFKASNSSYRRIQGFVNTGNGMKLYTSYICPCTGKKKIARYVQNDGQYKYLRVRTADVLPKNSDTDQLDGEIAQCPLGKDIYQDSDPIYEYTEAELKKLRWSYYNDDEGYRPEQAQLIIDAYGDFEYKTYNFVANSSDSTKCFYSDTTDSSNIYCDTNADAIYGYIWNNTDLKMISLEGDQDMYYLNDASIRMRIPANGNSREVMVARRGLYETEYKSATDTWEKSGAEEIFNRDSLTRQNTANQSYGWFLESYGSKIDFYINVKWVAPGVEENEDTVHIVRVKVGTFYIIKEWNLTNESPQDLIHPINSGLENVHTLERMEKCKASQTFCINADNNLRMANYRYMEKYAQAEMTVFIDPRTMKPYEPNATEYYRKNGQVVSGNLRVIKQHEVYYKWTRTIAPDYTTLGYQIVVDAVHFPGTYRLVGETYSRSRKDGKDQRFQFEIPLCKMSSETSLTLEAAGDPTTYTMNLKVLRRDDGVMMKLTQYDVDTKKYDSYASGSTQVVASDEVVPEDPSYSKLVGSD